jgi:hypothetical protein
MAVPIDRSEAPTMTARTQLRVPSQLNGRHRRICKAIFRDPTARNLSWHDVRSLLETYADVTESDHDTFRALRGGQEVTLLAPTSKVFATTEDVMTVRRFLTQTRESKGTESDRRVLVVIDHHEAKVYRIEDPGAVLQRIVPCDGYDWRQNSRPEEADGKRVQERKSYYEFVAVMLRGADRVLVFGGGTGEGSAMDQLVAYLNRHHYDLADRVVGTVVVGARHRTEGQLLAQAREFFASAVV